MAYAIDAVHGQGALRRFSPAVSVIPRIQERESAPLARIDFPTAERESTQCRFVQGESLFSEGDEIAHHYRIVSGAVRLFRTTLDGRRQITGFRLPGEILGFEWPDDCELSAEATRDVIAARCSRSGFERAIDEQPDVRKRTIGLLRQELAALQTHLVVLGRQTASERVVSFLIDFAKRSHTRDGTAFDIYVTREDLADYLGLTLETVSRVLSSLKRRNLIALPASHHVIIRSTPKLQALHAGAL
jgi:CRP/FNR family nitrogen fixation transcriptional regulator